MDVYWARDSRLGRTVAVEMLPPIVAGDARFRGRFYREALAIARLTHARIWTLYDVGDELVGV